MKDPICLRGDVLFSHRIDIIYTCYLFILLQKTADATGPRNSSEETRMECAQGCGTSHNYWNRRKADRKKNSLWTLGRRLLLKNGQGKKMMEPQGTSQITLASTLEAWPGLGCN